ncbi:MAG: four helix bundle protein [Gemmatimonadales bacterium]|nr:MAG: four helix bundle protein [Gemmatimonadales bacterium]
MWPYQRFDAWKVAHDLTLDVYHVTKRWPAEERFGLTAQVRRAAHSIGANIAEGSAKRGSREFRGTWIYRSVRWPNSPIRFYSRRTSAICRARRRVD